MGSFADPLNAWADVLGTSVGIPTAAYSYETLAQLKTQFANRLHDPSKIYWTDTELGVLLTEALRTFSFLTWHWRSNTSFVTTSAEPFYDLTTKLSTVLGQTVTDRNLITDIEYHFQEPPTTAWAGGWTGTAMFTMDDIAHALQKRRNKFLAETGVFITRTVQASGVPIGGRIALPEIMIDVRRMARVNSGVVTNLWRVDEHELTAYDTSWALPAAQDPTTYSILSSPPLMAQLAPAPTVNANLDILSVSAGANFTPTVAATVSGVPDDMSWIVKWGAMADLLQKDGPAQDLERAKYCEERYQHGVQLARMSASIVSARIDTLPLILCSLSELDAFLPGWQSMATGTPSRLASAGLNFVALSPTPAAANVVTLDVIRNAPIPANDADFVQIGREMISTILDYAVHLAMFKVGGDEWQTTNQLFDQFLSMCGNYNSRMHAATKIWTDMHNITNYEESTRLRIKGVRGKQND